MHSSVRSSSCRCCYSCDQDDAAVRLKLLGLLSLSPSQQQQQQHRLGSIVVTQMVACHREMFSGRSQGRCYSNSIEHRRLHRLMTAILLLENYTQVVP